MNLLEVNDPANWEIFQLKQPWTQFTQSWAWGEFRRSLGYPVRRFALADDSGDWLCAVQGEYRKKILGLGYWYASRGPVISPKVSRENYRALISHLISLMAEKGRLPRSLFWRFEPVVRVESQTRDLPPRFIRSLSLDPSSTNLLDLTQSEEQLLSRMHEKTRYNIKIATRHGVKTRVTSHPADIDQFLKLMRETETRAGFVQHSSNYIYKTLQTLAAAKMARLRVAELNGAMLAANFEIVYGQTLTYLYGASSHLVRQAMAPYALHWDAIRAAKQEGNKIYDFWGVNPANISSPLYKKSWEGITRFKNGWGGKQVDLIGTWDLPMNMTLYNLIFMRRMLSGRG
ncbi:MAG: peptidoglycan bridge formation glycyltransferase FemA/FemB family protein [Candidatus Portnoybacteria bacterium]|nr:peptidoglycan bridge formation glycyltransferase FemA/FemB family protein [Candidatus Portnoybacteria bacterium]